MHADETDSPGADTERLVADASRWLADARIDEAARSRSRERWLRQQAEEDATFAGVLRALSERGAPVTVTLADASAFDGTIGDVGADFVELRSEEGRTFIALAVVSAVDTQRGTVASDGRPTRSDRLLWQVVAIAAADRPRVVIRCGSFEIAGTLTAAGVDVLTVTPDGARTRPSYVRSGALSVVSFPGVARSSESPRTSG